MRLRAGEVRTVERDVGARHGRASRLPQVDEVVRQAEAAERALVRQDAQVERTGAIRRRWGSAPRSVKRSGPSVGGGLRRSRP